jgi:hypothetical protein
MGRKRRRQRSGAPIALRERAGATATVADRPLPRAQRRPLPPVTAGRRTRRSNDGERTLAATGSGLMVAARIFSSVILFIAAGGVRRYDPPATGCGA